MSYKGLLLMERLGSSKRLLLKQKIFSTLGVFFPLRVASMRIGNKRVIWALDHSPEYCHEERMFTTKYKSHFLNT